MRLYYLLDTTILIDALRAKRARRELLAELVRAGHTLATSVLNVAEIHAGMRAGEESATEQFLLALDCYELTRSAAMLAGKMKKDWAAKGRTLSLADTIVAAIAHEHGCVVITDNHEDFPDVPLYSMG